MVVRCVLAQAGRGDQAVGGLSSVARVVGHKAVDERHGLAGAGTPPTTVDTKADVTFQPGQGITGIKLTVHAVVPGLSAEQFEEAAQNAKANCPVSQALAGTEITLEATLDQ